MELLKRLKSIKKETQDEINWLVKNAYILGYEIGFYKHSEFIDWVQESKKEIMKHARSNKTMDLVLDAYEKGKIDGNEKDDRHLKALIGNTPEIQKYADNAKSGIFTETREITEKREGGLGVLRNPENTLRPHVTEQPKAINAPVQTRIPLSIKLHGNKKRR